MCGLEDVRRSYSDARGDHYRRPVDCTPRVIEEMHGEKHASVVRQVMDRVDAGPIVWNENALHDIDFYIRACAIERIRDDRTREVVKVLFVQGHT